MTRVRAVSLKRPGTGGFTLLELIVVLIIIGVGSALVVPRLVGGMGSLDVRTAAGKAAAVLRYAGSRAISDRMEHTAVFDMENNRLTIESVNDASSENEEGDVEEESAGSPEKVYDLPGKVFFEKADEEDAGLNNEAPDDENFKMTFYPSGGSDGGSVFLTNERGKRYLVTVDRITGSVKVTRGDNQ